MAQGSCPISVVIPAYQAASLLPRSVGSVLNQTLAPSEIIVVDDGSTDGTAEVARSLGERVYCLQQENGGVAAARNRGIAAASAEWIAFLDADDAWLPKHLAKCWDVIQRDPSLAWCCGAHRIISLDGNEKRMPTAKWMQLESTRENSLLFFDAVVAGAPLQTSGFLISQNVVRAVGVFDPGLRCGEDRDYWYRIALKYPRVGFVWPPTVRYILTEGSLTGRYGDETDRLLDTVSRNVARLDGLEPDTSRSFTRLLQMLARETMRHALNVGRPDCLRRLLAEFGWLLSRPQRLATWCGSRTPSSVLRRLSATYGWLRRGSKVANAAVR